jgi:hypothetical protein
LDLGRTFKIPEMKKVLDPQQYSYPETEKSNHDRIWYHVPQSLILKSATFALGTGTGTGIRKMSVIKKCISG